jgi:methylglyoxal synthase
MNIALVAHDSKKELMVQFCIAYYGILSQNSLCATGTTGKLVTEATGLKIARYLSGSQGGVQQLVSKISCNEIDILFFFRDPLSQREDNRPDDINILRVCDVHSIPLATNIATGEALIHALERGDLDWRKNVV